MCEREIHLLVGIIRQAFEDADRIGRGVRLTGQTEKRRTVELLREQEIRNLREWIARPADAGIHSLEFICDRIEALTHECISHADIGHVIELAIVGQTPPELIDWRNVSVTKPPTTADDDPSVRRERYLRDKTRRRERRKEAA